MCLASQTSPNISNLIEHGNLRFILMDAPNDGNLLEYLQAINKHNVTDIVRACEQTYGDAEAAKMGMTCHVSARCARDGRREGGRVEIGRERERERTSAGGCLPL